MEDERQAGFKNGSVVLSLGDLGNGDNEKV